MAEREYASGGLPGGVCPCGRPNPGIKPGGGCWCLEGSLPPEPANETYIPKRRLTRLQAALEGEIERRQEGAEEMRRASLDAAYPEGERKLARALHRDEKDAADRLTEILEQSRKGEG